MRKRWYWAFAVFFASLAFFNLLKVAVAQSVRVFEWHRGESTIAILFIHGLGGCAVPNNKGSVAYYANGTEDTFRNSNTGKSWPEIIASDDHGLAIRSLESIFENPLRIKDLG